MGQRLDDHDLLALQDEANALVGGRRGIITEQAIRDYRARARTP